MVDGLGAQVRKGPYKFPVNKTPIFIVLALALGLGVAAYVLLTGQEPAKGPEPVAWLASLDEGRVPSLKIRWEGGGEALVAREASTGLWLLRVDATAPWPVPVQRMRPLLRLLADVGRLVPGPGREPASATHVEVSLSDGTSRTIRFSDSPLGGRTLAMIEEGPGKVRYAEVDDGIRKALARDSLLGWREPQVLPHEGVDPSRIRVENGRGRLALSRVQNRWALTMPYTAPASPEAVIKLVRQIAGLASDRFLIATAPDDESLGADNPSTFVRLETDLRLDHGDQVDRRTLVEEIRVGRSADLAGTTLHSVVSARLVDPATNQERVLWGPVDLVLSREKVEHLVTLGDGYLSPRSSQLAAADVAGLTLEPLRGSMESDAPASAGERRRFRLAIEGWSSIDEGGQAKRLEKADAAQVAALVKALCELPAGRAGTGLPEATRPVARALMQSSAGGAGETLWLGVAGDGALVVRAGTIVRAYAEPWAAGLVQWLRTQLPPEG